MVAFEDGADSLVDSYEKLRVLIVTPSLPYPPVWGFGIRVYQMVRHLSVRHSVSLLTFAGPEQAESIQELERIGLRLFTVAPAAPGFVGKRVMQFGSLFARLSFQHRSLYAEAMQRGLTQLLGNEEFDIIQVESSQMGVYDYGGHSPVILDEHNIEYELLHRVYRGERSPLRRFFNWSEHLKFKREEQRLWNEVDACVLTSEREREIFATHEPGKASAVVPNGVDTTFFRPSAAPVDPNSIVFTGLMRYRPNVDGASYFVKEVLPLIVRARPEIRLTIVGAGPTAAVRQLAGQNVVVTGMVPDVRPYLESASVFVVPLRMGSGTRLKVLEGLAMGKATVSTSIGCEGIDVRDGEHLLVRDGPQSFADAVLRLLDDQDDAAALGLRGREVVLQKYDWQAIVSDLEGFYSVILSRDCNRILADPHRVDASHETP